VVVIPPRRDHSAVETGYYKATDIEKREFLFPQRLTFEALKAAPQWWKKHRAL
jgi:hypothetical protein